MRQPTSHRGSRRHFAWLVGLVAALSVSPAHGDVLGDVYNAIGLTSLQARLGAAAPTGVGIEYTQVEFGTANAYLPNTSQPELAGKTIIDRTGGGAVSSHATGVARVAYGTLGVAPGISTVNVYSADDWLGAGYLKTETAEAPGPSLGRVQNHSWVVARDSDPNNDAQEDATAIDSLRRLDLAIARDGVVAAVGVNNGSGSDLPLLLANSYNAIVVGQSNGGSSLGPSTLEVAGRSQPDIVAPGDYPSATATVSRATGRVSAAAALLLQAASGNAQAQRPEMIKSLLLTGATKNEFDLDRSTATPFDDWSHTSTQPLDLRYGAGELNIDNSDRIFRAGEQTASTTTLASATGWDLPSVSAGTQRYFFQIPAGATVESLTATAAWNRQIAFSVPSGGGNAVLTPSLANVDLKLYRAQVNSAHTAYQITGAAIDTSVSSIDNVEHIFDHTLTPGLYALELSAQQAATVGLAWDARFTAPLPRNLTVSALDDRKIVNVDSSGTGTVVADSGDGLLTPLSVAYDAQGRLYVADTLRSQVLRFDTPGGPGTVVASLGSGVSAPSGLAFDAAGDLFVSSYLTNSIWEINTQGQTSLFADAADGLDGPFGMAFDPSGRLVVASLDNKSILQLDATGQASVLADASDSLFTPISVAFNSTGELFIADTLTSHIWRMTSTGSLALFADLSDGIVSPTGLAFDGDDNLYVANYLVDSVVKLDPLGKATTYAGPSAGLNGAWSLAFAPQPMAASGIAARAVSVPEPSAAALLAVALAALAGGAWVGRRQWVAGPVGR